jgi:glycosyltransferase involved in cell wall biosynthesis
MRIAQVSPLYESVPPATYGGTERVVSYLTEELVAQGHEVTLFASGDSVTSAELVAACPRSLRTSDCGDPLAYHYLLLDSVLARRERFDVIHFHVDYLHFLASRYLRLPQLTTLHGRLDHREHAMIHARFAEMPLVSISDAQRRPLPRARWMATIHHGLPADLYELREGPQPYLAFLGRVSPEKGVDNAIAIAQRVGIPLKVAGKIDRADREYYESTIAPLLDSPGVEFVGEIGEAEKNDFLGNAQMLLFPIEWPEPFGLVMIEALACGTPVVAFDRGSVPEILTDGETAHVVGSVDEAVDALLHRAPLSRRRCREVFEERFVVSRMAHDYLAVYEEVAALRHEPSALAARV